ncbi:MAG: hypothetical protein DRJ97_01695 [Thermoprotei archaeon]|nr:MAG: hypothetical protein DRJ97_01695 [Thermoprotei archaeon]
MKNPSLPKIDLHIHTNYSDGLPTMAEVAKAARLKRLALAGVADHYGYAKGRMKPWRLRAYLAEAEAEGLLKGVEVDIFEDGHVDLAASERRLFDYVIGGVHEVAGVAFWGDPSPIPDPKGFVETVRVAVIEAIESGLIDIVAHLTWLPEDIRSEVNSLITPDWVDSVVKAAASKGVAIEVSGAWLVPDEWVVKRCLKEGVKLSMGSDAHRVEDVGNLSYPLSLFKRLGVKLEDLFIPRPLAPEA